MLRDYQTEICSKVEDALKKERSVMMQMPTGTGKTIVLAELVKRQLDFIPNSKDDGCRVLIVAHRIELIEQTGELLTRHGIDYGVIAGGRRPKMQKAVMVASVQTLSRKSDLSQELDPMLVIIDEAHHAVAKTYRMLWEAWPEARFLGLTATPYRMSGEGFTDLFDVMVTSWNMRRFVAEGWLATYDYYSIRPDSEQQQVIDGMKKRGADGDYQAKEMRDKLDVRPSIERLFETFEKYAFDKKGKTWVCQDTVTGIEFERHPRVIEYRGMEMVTADSETYYPRIHSQWIDASHGINVKALETQAGDGLSWKMMYVSLSSPEKVYRLQEVMYNDMRIYKDETGTIYFQQDLDHPLVSETEACGRQAFMSYCDKKKEGWLMAVENVKYHFIDKVFTTDEWQREHNATVEKDGEFYHVSYEEHGERKEAWADKKTGFYYLHRPKLRLRGFIELLHDGDMVFVRNIYHERYIPYRNWEIKADARLCAIDNRLYMREKPDAEGYRILKRSGDFVMFVVQGNDPKTYNQNYTIINKIGRDVEMKESE